MLYIFKSKVTGDVIMLQPNGERLLEIIGKRTAKEPSVKGILLVEQMPQALEALTAAIAQEDAARAVANDQTHAEDAPVSPAEAVGLRQRAAPFMDMICECLKAKEAILWGV